MANIINITDEKYNMALAALNSGIKIKKTDGIYIK